MHKIMLVVLCILVVSCGGLRKTSEYDAKGVSVNRVYKKEYLVQSPERNIKVTIIRDTGIPGSAAGLLLSIDKYKICELDVSEMIILYLSKGEHLFTIYPGKKGHGTYRTFNEDLFNIESDVVLRLTINDNGQAQLLHY